MFVIRFEVKETNKGIFLGRYNKSLPKITKKAIRILGEHHHEPFDVNANWGVRQFSEIKCKENIRFAFTPQFFENKKIARILVRLTNKRGIKMRIIPNPEIVWISSDGIQCCFIEKQLMSNPKKEAFVPDLKIPL